MAQSKRIILLAIFSYSVHCTVANNTNKTDKIKEEIFKIKQSLNEKVDPCSDFYSYVCGNYQSEEKIEEEFVDKKQLLQHHFYSGNYLSKSEIKAKEFYESCQAKRNGNQLKQLNFYKDFGGWPVLESLWNPRNFSWLHAIEVFKSNGIILFLVEDVEWKNGQQRIKIFPNLGHTISSVEEWVTSAYKTMMAFDASEELTTRTIMEVYPFVGKLHNLAYEALFKKSEETVQIPFKLFKEFYSEISDWDKHFKNVLGFSLKDADNIYINNKATLKKFLELLYSTDSKVIANYMWLDILRAANVNNCEGLVERYFQFLYSNFEERPQYSERSVLRFLGFIESELNKFPLEAIPNTTNIMNKLNLWKNYVTYRDPDLDIEYKNLEIIPNNFMQNYFNCIRYYSKSAEISGEDTMPSEKLWNFYNLIRYPSYSDQFPMSLNFARFGQSSLFSVFKKFKNSPEVQEVKACIENQNFPRNSAILEGGETASDSLDWLISSQIATKLALKLYKNWQQNNRVIQSNIRNLENERVFFVGYVSSKCSDRDLKEVVNINLKNLIEFSEAFKCNLGSQMNPYSKCVVF